MVQGWGQIICTCDQGRGGQLSASMYIAPAHTGDLGIRFQGAKLSLHCQGLANTKWLPCWICECDNSHKCDQGGGGGGLLSATMYIILAHTGDLESGSRRVQSWDYITRDLQIRSGYHVYLWMWYFTYGQGIIYTNMKNLWKIYCTPDSVMQKNHDVLFLKFLHNIEKNKCSIKKVLQPEIEVSLQVHAAVPHLCSTQLAPGKESFSMSFWSAMMNFPRFLPICLSLFQVFSWNSAPQTRVLIVSVPTLSPSPTSAPLPQLES